jgi:hypothetical protein
MEASAMEVTMQSAGKHERFPQTILTDEQAAVLIRVLLRTEAEMPLMGLAEELGLSDHQFGMGLGLLIRDAKAKIRQGPEGLVVYAPREVEATGPVAP